MGFGERLREERIRLGMTQSRFAEFGGIRNNCQCHYEKEYRKPTIEYLQNIDSIGVDVMYVVLGKYSNEL